MQEYAITNVAKKEIEVWICYLSESCLLFNKLQKLEDGGDRKNREDGEDMGQSGDRGDRETRDTGGHWADWINSLTHYLTEIK